MKNFTQTQTKCCDGYVVDADDEDSASHSFFHRRRRDNVLREKGCTISKPLVV